MGPAREVSALGLQDAEGSSARHLGPLGEVAWLGARGALRAALFPWSSSLLPGPSLPPSREQLSVRLHPLFLGVSLYLPSSSSECTLGCIWSSPVGAQPLSEPLCWPHPALSSPLVMDLLSAWDLHPQHRARRAGPHWCPQAPRTETSRTESVQPAATV